MDWCDCFITRPSWSRIEVHQDYANAAYSTTAIPAARPAPDHCWQEAFTDGEAKPISSKTTARYWMKREGPTGENWVHFSILQPQLNACLYTPALTTLKGRYTGFTSSVRLVLPSARLSLRLWTELCPLCNFHNTNQIHFKFTHLIKQLQ